MTDSVEHAALFWIIFSVALFVVELLTAPGVGLFLAGIGGIVTAGAVAARLVGAEAFAWQCALFFGSTLIATAILWRPLANFRAGRNRGGAGYRNVVGETATVRDGPLGDGRTGTVTWSGTVMNAELDASCAGRMLAKDSPVIIVAVQGTTLIVKPLS